MTAIAPQNLTYNHRSPYLTTAEFKGSPVAAAVDVSNLVPNGDLAVQERALSEMINQASAYADNYCLGAIGTLSASVNTENGRFRQTRQGFWTIHPAFWPILEVRSFAVGLTPSQFDALPIDNSTCFIEQRQFTVTTSGLTTSSAGPLSFSATGRPWSRPYFVKYDYVNGFFNQFLSAQVAKAATSIALSDTVGLYPGTSFTIYDGPLTETATVDSSWDSVSSTVPLTTGLAYGHGTGVHCSTIPATVKQAVTHVVVSMIKQRGQGGLVLDELGQPVAVTSSIETSMGDLVRAQELLNAFKQIWGRS